MEGRVSLRNVKGVTASGWMGGEIVASRHEYSEGRRSGSIVRMRDDLSVVREVETGGIFHQTVRERDIILSTSEGVEIRNSELERMREIGTGVSYYHSIRKDTLISTSAHGEFSLVDLESGKTSLSARLSGTHQCIHEVWVSSFIDSSTVAMGCDGGGLFIADLRDRAQREIRFPSGVTSLRHRDKERCVEVGTYEGMYMCDLRSDRAEKTGIEGIVWRVDDVEVEGKLCLILTQSHDGISLYSPDHKKLAAIETSDMFYSSLLGRGPRGACLYGFEYYSGNTFRIPVSTFLKGISGKIDVFV
jgi:hypothetical protein